MHFPTTFSPRISKCMASNIFIDLLGLGRIFGIFECKAAFVLVHTYKYCFLYDFTKISELLKLPNQIYTQQIRMVSSFKAVPNDTTVCTHYTLYTPPGLILISATRRE